MDIKHQRWKEVEYSRKEINDAGNTVRNGAASKCDVDWAVAVIDNWRAAHAYPLHVMYIHLKRIAKTYDNALVVERLKRLDSIINKLN